MKTEIPIALLFILLASCGNNDQTFDASGIFEADEVMVAAEVPGKIIQLTIEEGDVLPADTIVARIDATNLDLQKQQVEASMEALEQRTNDVTPQIGLLKDQLSVQQTQLETLNKEKNRFTALVKADAATPKQLDDIVAQINVLEEQMKVTKQQMKVTSSNTSTQNRSILSEKKPLSKRADILADQIARADVSNPIAGTVLVKYALQGEMIAAGKALYKIANLNELNLRAYITGDQLAQIKLGQPVKVFVDSGDKNYKPYDAKIIWISDKAEFTPKTIQTKDERANLVYAIKIKVKNDGYLKIGQYGEVTF